MAPTTYYYYSPNHVAFMKVEDIVRLRLPLPVGCKFWFRPHLRTLKFLFSSLVVTRTLNLAEIHVCVLIGQETMRFVHRHEQQRPLHDG